MLPDRRQGESRKTKTSSFTDGSYMAAGIFLFSVGKQGASPGV
jgi:hypothetical protein